MSDTSATPVVRVRNLCVERGDAKVLDDVSWTIGRGEHWVLLGANGSGKTSLLSALLSYIPARRGSIEVLGQRYGASDWRPLRQRVGIVSTSIEAMIVPYETALAVVYSGKEAMIGSWGQREEVAERRASELLDRVRCGYARDRRFEVLSHGERQRVLIARALMADPALLILDEPCTGLDIAAREAFLGFVDALARTPNAPALILVTHHVEEIGNAFEHVLLLKGGSVLASGDKRSVLTSRNLSTAFDTEVVLRTSEGRYSVAISGQAGSVV